MTLSTGFSLCRVTLEMYLSFLSLRVLSYKWSFRCPSPGSLKMFPLLGPFTLTGEEGKPLGFGGWAERK